MREKISQEVPMSHSFYGMPSHTTYSSLRIARLNQKLSAQQPHLPVESVSASDSLMDSISCQQFPLNLLGLTGRPENHCSPSTPNRLSDPFAWDLDMEHVPVDPGLVNHHNQAATENTAYSPSRITIPRYEYGDWSDINQLFPDKDKLEQSATYTDFQAAHTPHELNSPASFPDSEAFLSQYDLQTSPEPRPTFESPTSRPGSAVYSSFTPNYSLASSPMGETHPSVQPRSVPDGGVRLSEEDSDTDSATSDEPYARLIWRALMSARDHKMVLKEIYEWFEKNTNKAKNPDSKGWQNSIRHNLSMNAAFEGLREPSSPGGQQKKSGNVWVLTEDAIRNGVQSTTRYRKHGVNKKNTKSEHPAPQRQRSGAKGGRAAKKAAKFRRALQEAQRAEENYCTSHNLLSEGTSVITATQTPYVGQEGPLTPVHHEMDLTIGGYDLSGLSGCTDFSPGSPGFYHNLAAGEEGLISDYSALNGQTIGPVFNSFM